jgi:hypothetical protein
LTLLARVAAHLAERGSDFAVIGAAALAVHGVARSTLDLDLLAADRACLEPGYWDALRDAGSTVEVYRGDDADPLAGVARLRAAGEPPVDVVVAKPAWQREVVARAVPAEVEGAAVRAVTAADLILLKLYAGGPQDAWDVVQLLALDTGRSVAAQVEARLDVLPDDARRLWTVVTRLRGDA